MKNLIKVVNPVIAKELALAGFSYMQEETNGTKYYVFPSSADLLKTISSKYSQCDFIVDNKLRF